MAPESVVQSIRLIVASVGGTPAGNEQRLIAAVRSRLNGRYEDMSNLEVQLRAFLHGSEPIVHYIQASVPAKTLQDMNKEHFGEFVHRLFLAVAARTRLAGKFAALLDSQQHWGSVEAGLKLILSGDSTACAAPALRGQAQVEEKVWSPAATVLPPWWSSRRATAMGILLCSIGTFYLRALFEAGRSRFYLLTISGLLFFGALVYWQMGPEMWPYFMLKALDVATADEDESDAESAASEVPQGTVEPPLAPPVEEPTEPSAIDRLSKQMEALTKQVTEMAASPARPAGVPSAGASPGPIQEQPERSAALDTLLHFANATSPPGPISQTAARQMPLGPPGLEQPTIGASPIRLEQHLPAPDAWGPPASPAPAWAPLVSGTAGSSQAAHILQLLIQRQGSQTTNPYWGQQFWQDVYALECANPIEPDLMRLLRSHGYVGAHSLGAPRPDMRRALESIRDAGAPLMGAPFAPAATAGLPEAMPGVASGRWENALPPEMPRAAPQIYRALRAEGAASTRDWLNLRYQGEKNNKNDQWIDLWSAASEVDFALEQVPSGQEATFLAASDSMEIKLRRLAAHVHYARTGDLTAYTRMLALQPPGTSSDVAPKWMVEDATTYSKTEHQRDQRVKESERGRGRGRGFRGRGDQQGGGGAGAGNDRGRGRGGRGA